MIEWLSKLSVVDAATILTAVGAIAVLWYSARANTLAANAHSLQITYDFLDRTRSHIAAIRDATDSQTYKSAFESTLDFFEAASHGINNQLLPKPASTLMTANLANYIAVIELTEAAHGLKIPTSDVYAELAKFTTRNRPRINESKKEQKKALNL
ncbi:hypothetical protein [Shinella zoogloeoides]|uniref:hypothetical protein n=1 Tax=Shinella zoogloeoides TaxID=352475 RepID=UPI00299E0811|nr:hypothetical protein [Shinella zoogloeoides]WPE19944.1 hypothetical protein ShzoTeo12_11240 [Shinella zoogloeoides]